MCTVSAKGSYVRHTSDPILLLSYLSIYRVILQTTKESAKAEPNESNDSKRAVVARSNGAKPRGES